MQTCKHMHLFVYLLPLSLVDCLTALPSLSNKYRAKHVTACLFVCLFAHSLTCIFEQLWCNPAPDDRRPVYVNIYLPACLRVCFCLLSVKPIKFLWLQANCTTPARHCNQSKQDEARRVVLSQ